MNPRGKAAGGSHEARLQEESTRQGCVRLVSFLKRTITWLALTFAPEDRESGRIRHGQRRANRVIRNVPLPHREIVTIKKCRVLPGRQMLGTGPSVKKRRKDTSIPSDNEYTRTYVRNV
ncbi:hypothetical protein N7504_001925 [Penicillium tannophilum]|nr:hypothetical protein N7504_001925 [Penicillium tannophilum]